MIDIPVSMLYHETYMLHYTPRGGEYENDRTKA